MDEDDLDVFLLGIFDRYLVWLNNLESMCFYEFVFLYKICFKFLLINDVRVMNKEIEKNM